MIRRILNFFVMLSLCHRDSESPGPGLGVPLRLALALPVVLLPVALAADSAEAVRVTNSNAVRRVPVAAAPPLPRVRLGVSA